VTRAAHTLAASGHAPDEARRDAALLARWLQGWDAAGWLARSFETAPAEFEARLEALVSRRAAGVPLAYLTGTREFYGRPFRVTPAVLIPRPETELVIDEALARLDESSAGSARAPVVDVGTGSGCLAITLALERPGLDVIATDISPAALAVAGENARALGVAAHITFVEHAFLPPLPTAPHLIVTNPPYVPETDRASLPVEVRDHEPGLALFAGPDGLDAIRLLVPLAACALAAGGSLVMEIGAGQAAAVTRLIETTPDLELDHIAADLQSIPRVIVAKRR
jgi:release factor glutamine methyltransferase